MASFYDLLMNQFFPQPAPLQMPSFAPQESTHYKTGLEGLAGGGSTTIYKNDFPFADAVPAISSWERPSLLSQMDFSGFAPSGDSLLADAPQPEAMPGEIPTINPDYSLPIPPSTPDGINPDASIGFKAPPNAGEIMGAGASKLNLGNLGMGLMNASLNPPAPQYAPAAPGHRPDPVSIAALMQAYGIRR